VVLKQPTGAAVKRFPLHELPTSLKGMPTGSVKLNPVSVRAGAEKALRTPGLHPGARRHFLLVAACMEDAADASVLYQPQSRKVVEAIIDKLPESVQKPCRALLAVEDLSVSLGQSWNKRPPDVNVLRRQLVDVHGGSQRLAARLRKLAVAKAEREVNRQLAQKIRDVKLDVDRPPPPRKGDGDVELLLLPEAPAGSRAGQRGGVGKGLAELDEEATAEFEDLRGKAGRAMDRFIDFRFTISHSSYYLAMHTGGLVVPGDKEERKKRQKGQQQRLAEVRRGLGRKLRPSERLLVADMNDKPVAEIVKILSELD
jgi:hypothetical protein